MIKIRCMAASDLEFAAERTAAVGWLSETLLETAGFYTYHPEGCFIAEQGGRPVGICFGIPYGRFGFLGQLIVNQEERGLGIGRQLIDHTLAYLQSIGTRTIFLDGVLPAVSLYERVGFTKQFHSLRFKGKVEGKNHPEIFPMQMEDIEMVCSLDLATFGADRSYFLKRRFHFYPALCKVVKAGERIEGFIMGHYGHKSISVGPWVASGMLESPLILLQALALEVPEASITLGCLEANQQAVQLLRSQAFTERPDSPWRMVYGEDVQFGIVEQNYAIGSPAKG